MRYKISHALVQFGGDVILCDVNFEVHDKEKIAIVGRNGCGKTTLLRLIAGDISMNNLDSDEECGITMAGKQEIGFLRQVNFTEKDVTVEEEIKKVFEPVFACEKRMRELENEMKTSADKQLLREYDNLQSRMEAMRGYSWQQDMETMFQRFGFALEDLKRLIDAEWQHDEESGSSGLYRAEIKIYGNNRTGLLVDITKVFTEREIDIDSIHSKTSKQGIATIDVSFSTKGREELTSVVERLRQIESIIDIERTTG